MQGLFFFLMTQWNGTTCAVLIICISAFDRRVFLVFFYQNVEIIIWTFFFLNSHTCQKAVFLPKGWKSIVWDYSVQFRRSGVSDSLRPHGPQHTRPPCPSPAPGVYPNSCPSKRWCHPAISSSVLPFSSYPQSFPASGSFPVSQLFTSAGLSTGVSASVLPMNIHCRFPLGWTGWISLQSKGLSRVFSNTTVQKHQFFGTQLSL